jgi:hypothetical protein
MWKPLIAGLSGTLVHFFFMYFKTRAGILPSFQPYQTLQLTLNRWVGTDLGWIFMGLIFFPVIGLGSFAFGAGLGIAPAFLSLAMLLTYSLVLGTVYAALDAWPSRKEI